MRNRKNRITQIHGLTAGERWGCIAFIAAVTFVIIASTFADNTNRIDLPLIERNTAQSHLLINDAHWILDALVAGTVARYPAAASPVVNAATEGDMFIVPAGAEGDWAGQEENLAIYRNTDWAFIQPIVGTQVTHATQGYQITYDGSDWGPSNTIWTRGAYISSATNPAYLTNAALAGRITLDATHSALDDIIDIQSNGRTQMKLTRSTNSAANYSQLSIHGPNASGTGTLSRIILSGYTGTSLQDGLVLQAAGDPADASITVNTGHIWLDSAGDLKIKINIGSVVKTGTIVDYSGL